MLRYNWLKGVDDWEVETKSWVERVLFLYLLVVGIFIGDLSMLFLLLLRGLVWFGSFFSFSSKL